jgi:membrane associated rhomboid family serine protease
MNDSATPSAQSGVTTCYRHPDREAYIRCQRCDRFICPDCMRPASVGFQCPECVKEGAKATRAGRTAYGGLRPTDASITSGVLIALNVAVWIAILATGGHGSRLADWLGLRGTGVCDTGGDGLRIATQAACEGSGSTWIPGVSDGGYWEVVTSMFTHVEVWHIFGNMFALWLFGPQLEAQLGRVRFLALYFLAGLGGSAGVLLLTNEYTLTYGASGAVFGLLGAFAIIAVRRGDDLRPILVWIAILFFLGFVGTRSVSWQGHLGGLVAGALAAAVVVFAPRGPRRTPVQVAGLVGLAVAVLAVIALRAAALA